MRPVTPRVRPKPSEGEGAGILHPAGAVGAKEKVPQPIQALQLEKTHDTPPSPTPSPKLWGPGIPWIGGLQEKAGKPWPGEVFSPFMCAGNLPALPKAHPGWTPHTPVLCYHHSRCYFYYQPLHLRSWWPHCVPRVWPGSAASVTEIGEPAIFVHLELEAWTQRHETPAEGAL